MAKKVADKVYASFVHSAIGLGGKKASRLKPEHKKEFFFEAYKKMNKVVF